MIFYLLTGLAILGFAFLRYLAMRQQSRNEEEINRKLDQIQRNDPEGYNRALRSLFSQKEPSD